MRSLFPGLARTTTRASQYQHRFIIAITVTLASVLELLDTSIVNVALPHMMGTLGATLDEIAWMSTGYVVANVIVLPISGWLAAQFGRRNYFAFSILVFILSSFACGQADSLGVLIFWRIVQGLGGGGLLSTAQTTLYDVFPREETGTSMAIFGMGIMVGPMLGPTVGGYLTEVYSWPWIFYINVPLGLIALILALIYVPDAEHGRASRVDYIGLLLLTIGIGSLQLMLERGDRLDWFESGEVIAYMIASVLGIFLFAIRQLEVAYPIVNLRILRDRQFSIGLVYGFCLGAALYSTVFVFPVYVQTLMNFNAWQTGLVILPTAIGSGVTMAVCSKLLQRGIAPQTLMVVGTSLFAYGMWGHGHFTTLSGSEDFFWPLVARGVGLGMLFIPLSNLTMAGIAPKDMPGASGLFNLTRQLGGSVGIASTATLIASMSNSRRAELLTHIGANEPGTQERLQSLIHYFTPLSQAAGQAKIRALGVMSQQIAKQAAMLTYEQLFMSFGLVMLCALPLLLGMRRRATGPIQTDAH